MVAIKPQLSETWPLQVASEKSAPVPVGASASASSWSVMGIYLGSTSQVGTGMGHLQNAHVNIAPRAQVLTQIVFLQRHSVAVGFVGAFGEGVVYTIGRLLRTVFQD